ncbi:MAG: O-antigen ligase family protein [Methylacidiphilales bacterium]|nr:O-antigen ligase family protein [Candidatus Methylacidiphilales bacterium]MDW8348784.1 O-antigen ligase family protein [Verrucomicrobiae bacterium]
MPIAVKVFFAHVLGILLAIYFGQKLAESDWLPIFFITAIVFTFVAVVKYQLIAFAVVAFAWSNLTAPFIPGQMNLHYLFGLALIFVTLLRLAFTKTFYYQKSWAHFFVIIFAGVLALTMAYRGSGFRLLGSESWGGMNYVLLFISISVVFLLPYINLPEKIWPKALTVMALLCGLRAFAEFLIMKGIGGDLLNRFVEADNAIIYAESSGPYSDLMFRVLGLRDAGIILLMALACHVDFNKIFRINGLAYALAILMLLAITAFSGFRIGVTAFILYFCIILFYHRAWSIKRLINFIGVTLVALIIVGMNLNKLPDAGQRAFSWIPGAKVERHVEYDAEMSALWRLELWEIAMELIPKYWLVGKGYAFSFNELISVLARGRSADGSTYLQDQHTWAIVTGNYHNGVLSALLGLGIFGLIAVAGFMVCACYRHHRFTRSQWNSNTLKMCHTAVTALFITLTITFWLMYGDVRQNMPTLLFLFACMEALLRCDKNAARYGSSLNVQAKPE